MLEPKLSPKTKGIILHCPVICSTKPYHFPTSKQVSGYTEISHLPWPVGALVIPFQFMLLLFSLWVMFSSLWPHGLQFSRLPCPLLSPRVFSYNVHWIGDAIQPSYPLKPPFPPALNLSQHQGLFLWVGSLHQVDKILALHLQHQSFQWIFRTDFF